MSGDFWTHTLCWECYVDEYPGKPPTLVTSPDGQQQLRPCCRCNTLCEARIFVRGPALEFTCGGHHAANSLTWLLTHRMVGTWLEPMFIDHDPADGIDE